MASFERLSYVQSNEDGHISVLSTMLNPCKSLTEVFDAISEEEIEAENLKVYLRLRPLLSEDTIISQDGNIEIIDNQNISITAPSCSHAFKNKPQGITKVTQRFKFSRVYDQETSQKVLFEETTQELVNDLIKGQNCLLFSYGATNSGKTYTIQGTPSKPGLLPQTLASLFKSLSGQQYEGNNLKPFRFCGVVRLDEKECLKEEETKEQLLKQGTAVGGSSFYRSNQSLESRLSGESNTTTAINETSTEDQGGNIEELSLVADNTLESTVNTDSASPDAFYAVYVSFAEIYNEYIYDLLEKSSFTKNNRKNALVLGEDRDGAMYIKGLKEIRVKNAEEALKILEAGRHNLHFAATKLNHHSSRSHCIFTLKLIRLADPLHPNFARVSMLSLCDLAGAERTGKTLSSMDRLKEASNINTSLLVLGRCIAALRHNQIVGQRLSAGRKPIPIPYRDSKVTRLFQPFFTGKGKVNMIVNVSMATALFDETLKVLKFSALAGKVLNTREKVSVVDQIVEEGPKGGSQFSRFMRQSLNMSSSTSGRLSVPWQGKSFVDVTFGAAGNAKDVEKLVSVPEEQGDDEEDERYAALLDLIAKLKDKLLKECKEKAQLEKKLRAEICDAFSKRIVQIEDSWRTRLEEERYRAEELMDWRMRNVLETKINESSRKRLRQEDSDDEETVPSILLVREEIKVKDLAEEKANLEEELETMKSALKASSKTIKSTQEENSKLLFDLATSTRLLDEMKREKEDLMAMVKQPASSAGSDNETINDQIIQELHLQLQSKEKALEQMDKKVKTMADMLEEAAEEFIEKEQIIGTLKASLASEKESRAQGLDTISDLEAQLSEAKHLLDNRGRYLEEREQQIYEMQSQHRQHQGVKSEESSPIHEDDHDDVDTENKHQNFLRRNGDQLLMEIDEMKVQLEEARARNAQLEQTVTQHLANSSEKQKIEEEEKGALEEEVRVLKERVVSSEKDLQKGKQDKAMEMERYQKQLKALESDLQSSTRDYESLLQEKNKYEERLSVLVKDIDLLSQQKRDLEEEATRVKTDNEYLLEELEKMKTCKEDLKQEIERSREDFLKKHEEMEEQSEELKTKILIIEREEEARNILREEMKKLSENVEESRSRMTSLSEDSKEMQITMMKHAKEAEDLRETLLLKKQIEETMWKDLDELRNQNDELKRGNEDQQRMEERYTQLEQQLQTKENQIESLISETSRLGEENDSLKKRLAQMEGNFRAVEQDGDTIREQISLTEDKLAELRTTNASMECNVRDAYELFGRLFERWFSDGGGTPMSFEALKNGPIVSVIDTSRKRFEELATYLQTLEDTYSKMKNDLKIAEENVKEYSEAKNCLVTECKNVKLELVELQDKMRQFSSLNSKNQELKSLLQTKESTIFNISSKNELLDQKVTCSEAEVESLKTKYELLEKETAAIREARSEEVGQLRSELAQKEREISALQQEIKRALQMSVASDTTTEKGGKRVTNVKEETMEWQSVSALHEELRINETEKSSSLNLRLLPSSSSQPDETVVDHFQDSNQSHSQTTDASNKEASLSASTAPPRNLRGKGENSRSRSRKRDDSSAPSLTTAETSAANRVVSFSTPPKTDADVTPVRQTRSTRTRSSTKKEDPQKISPVVRSRRKTATKSRVDTEEDEDGEGKEEGDDDEEFCLPKSTKKTTRGRSRRTTTKSVANPHLEDKENKVMSTTPANQEVSLEKVASNPPRSRRRRPLYSLEVEEPFDASPDLLTVRPVTEDSPHTAVKRNLRRIIKRH